MVQIMACPLFCVRNIQTKDHVCTKQQVHNAGSADDSEDSVQVLVSKLNPFYCAHSRVA